MNKSEPFLRDTYIQEPGADKSLLRVVLGYVEERMFGICRDFLRDEPLLLHLMEFI